MGVFRNKNDETDKPADEVDEKAKKKGENKKPWADRLGELVGNHYEPAMMLHTLTYGTMVLVKNATLPDELRDEYIGRIVTSVENALPDLEKDFLVSSHGGYFVREEQAKSYHASAMNAVGAVRVELESIRSSLDMTEKIFNKEPTEEDLKREASIHDEIIKSSREESEVASMTIDELLGGAM